MKQLVYLCYFCTRIIRKKNDLKRIILYTLLFIGAGCKVTQPVGNRTEQQPESSQGMNPEAVVLAITDPVPSNDTDPIRSNDTDPVRSNDTDRIRANETEAVIEAIDSLIENAGLLAEMPDSLDVLAAASTTGDVLSPDSLDQLPDSLLSGEDLLQLPDTVSAKKGTLEAPVEYTSSDSIVWTADNMAFLFGDGNVKYQSIELTAAYIQMNMDSSQLFATFGVDSLGTEFGHPVFTEKEQKMESKEMYYNFKSTKGLVKHTISQQGEGTIIAGFGKKMDNDVLFMADAKYTTCDEIDHPHFYIWLKKAKVWPGKNVVSGPAVLYIEDVPLYPIVLPFAFFPFTDTYSSGIIMPTYGDEMNRGFYLRNGGYYFALSDYFDLSLTGELYTKGSWGLSGQTSYKKRYKYSGRVSLSYLTTVTGDKGLDDYSKRKDFSIKLSHSQDPKANPYRTVSASVDYSSSSYDRNQLNSLYTPAATQNNKGSSVSFSKKFPNSPFNISAAMNINQRSQDSSVSVTLPDMTVTMSRIYPFKRKNAIGKDHWYDKISVNYNAQIRNSISTKEDLLFKSNFVKDWKNGVSHKSDINATYSILDVINLSPNFSYSERWYSHRIEQSYDIDQKRIAPTDTIYGFNRVYNYSGSISASTTLYGMFTPWKPFRKYVKTIRHRMDPSISFSAMPDFGDPKYGFHKTYTFVNGTHTFPGGIPDTLSKTYSPFDGQLFGVPGRGKSGSISFSLDNNIEAKIPDENEKSGDRIISIIDKLSASTSYNLAADSFKWNNLNTSMRLKLTKSYTLNLNAVFDTYLYDYDEIEGPNNTVTYSGRRVNKTRFASGSGLGRVGRLMSTGTSYSYTFNNDTFKKWFGGEEGRRKSRREADNDDLMEDMEDYDPLNPDAPPNRRAEMDRDRGGGGSLFGKKKQNEGEYDDDGYYNVTIPWSLSLNYNLSIAYDRQKFNVEKKEYEYQFVHAFSFNGSLQPTKNWRVNFNATYDFKNHKISYATCNISRSMHCFQMSASVIPFGPMKSYSFSIAASSSLLKDLKWDQRSSPYNNQEWY